MSTGRGRGDDDPIPLSESLARLVRSLRPGSGEGRGSGGPSAAAIGGVFGRWDDVVGAAIAAHVQPVRLDGTRLVVTVDDPAWITHLRFLEADLVRRLAEVAGTEITALEMRVARR